MLKLCVKCGNMCRMRPAALYCSRACRGMASRKPRSEATHKRCAKCGEVKPRDQFSPRRDKPVGLRPYCKPCFAQISRGYYRENRETVLNKLAQKRLADVEFYRKRDRENRERNKDRANAQLKAWREENKERYLAKQRKAYQAHRKDRIRYSREYWENNPVFRAKAAIHKATGLSHSEIPTELAEAKAAQLAVLRAVQS
jgi:hypothetical protein